MLGLLQSPDPFTPVEEDDTHLFQIHSVFGSTLMLPLPLHWTGLDLKHTLELLTGFPATRQALSGRGKPIADHHWLSLYRGCTIFQTGTLLGGARKTSSTSQYCPTCTAQGFPSLAAQGSEYCSIHRSAGSSTDTEHNQSLSEEPPTRAARRSITPHAPDSEPSARPAQPDPSRTTIPRDSHRVVTQANTTGDDGKHNDDVHMPSQTSTTGLSQDMSSRLLLDPPGAPPGLSTPHPSFASSRTSSNPTSFITAT